MKGEGSSRGRSKRRERSMSVSSKQQHYPSPTTHDWRPTGNHLSCLASQISTWCEIQLARVACCWRLLTLLLDELVQEARLAHPGIANHKKLEQVVCRSGGGGRGEGKKFSWAARSANEYNNQSLYSSSAHKTSTGKWLVYVSNLLSNSWQIHSYSAVTMLTIGLRHPLQAMKQMAQVPGGQWYHSLRAVKLFFPELKSHLLEFSTTTHRTLESRDWWYRSAWFSKIDSSTCTVSSFLHNEYRQRRGRT